MQEQQALDAFASLSQEARFRIVRRLVVAGADGMAAGAIGEAVGVSGSRLSFHLSDLERSGLIRSRREGRSIIYSAIFTALSDLVALLMRDCCEGHCEVCDQAISLFARCNGRPQAVADQAPRPALVCSEAVPSGRPGARQGVKA
ncbi:transcriptional regulator [Roseomonas sp. KE2513]|uniref:ArsR/SmtB family transcription factor n=1 Tax=Roseomonas sp. KE2513 TaxID=2479202 RepID=UPI0018DF3240|nr:metalloregulator ArsR/SmtB family transcription factor [Roseomonas sp. KE2513]MBI0538459.1 transcriptional regulator [Roseomonas sp. KE2513]